MTTHDGATADPISAAIVRSGLASTAREVFDQFVRTALVPLIYEAYDFSVAVFDSNVDVVADASGLPEYVGSLAFTTQRLVAEFGAENLEDGDVIVCSEPFLTGGHPPDIAVVGPAFVDGTLVGFVALRGHMGDVGARTAEPADSTSVYEEGLVLPPLKFMTTGGFDEVIAKIIGANSRLPRETVGTLKAAAAAIRQGTLRFARIVRAYGEPSYRLAVEELMTRSEQEVREIISRIPDGEYVVRDQLDHTVISTEPVPLVCTVRISGSDVEVDVTGSAPQFVGSMNVPYAQTVAACRLAIKRLTTQDRNPANSGEYRVLTVVAPEGSVFNAQPPAGTFLMHVTASLLSEMIITALQPAMPDVIPAHTGGHTTAYVGSFMHEGSYVQSDDSAPIGYGALEGADGAHALQHFSIAGIALAPAEVWEARAPIMKLTYALARDSGGAGRWRGGLGSIVQWGFDTDATLSFQAQRTIEPAPPGPEGGGAPGGRNDVQIGDGSVTDTAFSLAVDIPIARGQILTMHGAGGAGYGDPLERDPELVRLDVQDGLVSVAAAAADYGVVLDPETLDIDVEATHSIREKGTGS
jgi:N-methylhydantoinase B